jgi:hypothetical protein
MSVKRFREYADECMGWAKAAKSDKDCRSCIQMAETWLKVAAEYQKGTPAKQRSDALDRPPSR